MGRFTIEDRSDWRWWVTPKPLAEKAIHRWYVFPHSFTSELVHALIDEWDLTSRDRILDPFVGAGTTLLAAKERGIPASGYDLSPLAVLAAQVKTARYSGPRLRGHWGRLRRRIDPSRWNGASRDYPDLVRAALSGRKLGAFDAMDRAISSLKASPRERDFFRLALLATVPEFSRALATGGWLQWVDRRRASSTILPAYSRHVGEMLGDLEGASLPRRAWWCAARADARALPDASQTYRAVITSPPYPNRHDYTRVFGVELMFAFMNWEETRELRYQSFHSHPEAKPVRPDAGGYRRPWRVARAVAQIGREEQDPRVGKMIDGYFLDIFLALREAKRVCKRGGRIAFVVGNAQYRGVPVAVDELTAELGEQAGLKCREILAARYRGNSAQQMAEFGRAPSRESVVVFKRP